MNRAEVLRVYDDADFVAAYNDRFLLAHWPKHGADFEISMLQQLLAGGGSWLDVGCGTGWFLSQFPDTDRAGLDLSPAMVAEATRVNPSARFIRQGDFTVDVEEFHGAWSLVSCMWMAYCYLESMPEVEALVANMVRWTSDGGTVFIPSVIDLEDLRQHVQVPYEETYMDVWGGRIALTGYNWTWEEPNGNVNENMMAVHVGHFVRLLEPHFEKVEVVRYPVFRPGDVSRKAVVATGRRPAGQTGAAEVVWHPVPRHPDEEAEEARLAEAEARAAAALQQVRDTELAEAAHAARAVAWAEATAEAEAHAAAARDQAVDREIARVWAELAAVRGEVGEVHAHIDRAVQPPPPATVPVPVARPALAGTSTRRLAGELARRLNPLRPSLWRKAARRVRRKLR